MRAGAAAERLDEVGELLVLGELVLAGARHIENLAATELPDLEGLAYSPTTFT
jgi:hypothetical protein